MHGYAIINVHVYVVICILANVSEELLKGSCRTVKEMEGRGGDSVVRCAIRVRLD